MQVWITKYALTSGILIIEAEDIDTNRATKMCSIKRSESHLKEYFYGDDFHLNAESAMKDAEERRIKKLKSLEKQIKKISALKFEC